MAYIKIQRLNGANKALKHAELNTTTLMQVAYQWEFWSAGHFSEITKKCLMSYHQKHCQRYIWGNKAFLIP
ncbi:hypothetical protein AMR41_04455 [Hapalosiphon sp. MRB220]|nr:hypothetical protein AMR41_04455 [Hapalosiphon sp. MRB220]